MEQTKGGVTPMKNSMLVIALLLVLCSPVFSQPPGLVKWKELAEQGDADAQLNWGALYANGSNGLPHDDAEAVKWYRLAAEQGHPTAQFYLGLMYVAGRGVPKNDAEAVKWYRLAAERGDYIAQYNLGLMYAQGMGVPQNDARAYLWYSMAAAQGFELASEARDTVSKLLNADTRNSAQQLATRCFDSGFKQCE